MTKADEFLAMVARNMEREARTAMLVEILDPMGAIAYRRPHKHKDVAEALRTEGYRVRFPRCGDMRLLEEIGCRDGVAYPVQITESGMVIDAVPE